MTNPDKMIFLGSENIRGNEIYDIVLLLDYLVAINTIIF